MRRGDLLEIETRNNSVKLFELAEPYVSIGNIKAEGLKRIKAFVEDLPEDEREGAIDGFVLILIHKGYMNNE